MTNGDRIREMSNDELAEIITCPYDIEPDMCNAETGCLECRDRWLAEEERNDGGRGNEAGKGAASAL